MISGFSLQEKRRLRADRSLWVFNYFALAVETIGFSNFEEIMFWDGFPGSAFKSKEASHLIIAWGLSNNSCSLLRFVGVLSEKIVVLERFPGSAFKSKVATHLILTCGFSDVLREAVKIRSCAFGKNYGLGQISGFSLHEKRWLCVDCSLWVAERLV